MAKSLPKPRLPKTPIGRRLRVLLGTWKVQGRFTGGDEPLDERGTVTFRWLEKDALVVMRSRMRVAPESVAVIGADYSTKAFTMLYSDERRVVRRYEMTLTARRWTYARKERGFVQRATARIAANGREIRAIWEKSADGRRWTKDFDLVYTRQRR